MATVIKVATIVAVEVIIIVTTLALISLGSTPTDSRRIAAIASGSMQSMSSAEVGG